MSIFSYSGRDLEGRRQKGWIEADSTKTARTILSERGIFCEHVKEARPALKGGAAARSRFYNEIGVLLNSGFTLEQALGMLGGEGSENSAFTAAVRDAVRGGASFTDAMAASVPSLPLFEKVTISTSEKTGLAGDVLTSLSAFMESEREAAEKVKAALAYPIAVFVLAFTLLSLMVFVILPKAVDMFSRSGGRIPESTRLLAFWGPVAVVAVAAAIALTIVAAVVARKRSAADPELAAKCDALKLRIPVVNRLVPHLWCMRFAGTMSLLLKSGVNPQSAFAAAGASTGSPLVAKSAEAASADIRNGMSITDAVSSIRPIAPLLSEWCRIGESSGNLAPMLEQAATRSGKKYSTATTRLLAILEPALIVAVGIVVLVVASAVIKPMLELTRSSM